MRCKVRYIARTRSGSVSHSDQTVEIPGRRITLGRGTDSHVYLKDLRVNYHHAEIVVRDYDVIIEAVGESVLRVDGVPVGRAAVTPESEIEVGPYRIQLVPDEPDADLTFAVELIAPLPAESVDKLLAGRRLGVEGGLLRKRPLSWALFALLVIGGLAVPILAHRTPEPGEPLRVTARVGAQPAEQTAPLAGFDRIWISGDLSSSHKVLADNCGVCHEQPFVPVRSEACASCHGDVEHHFETARFQFADFEPAGCMGCHTEHQESTGVIPVHQSLCADCHRDLERTQPESTLLNATDFGTDHPEFRPTVLIDPARREVARVALGAPTFPKEMSNLRFPHEVHLAEVCKLKGENAIPPAQASEAEIDACTVLQQANSRLGLNRGLGCADCHKPEPGGVNMLPVNMEDHCADCHRLEFDPKAPGRRLPHGEPEEVIAVIDDFYAADLLRRGSPAALQAAQATVQALRQRPGGAGAGAPPAPAPQPAPDPIAEAVFVSEKKLEDIFGRSLCGVCHETVRPAESETGRWQVKPVVVTPIWMPKATFDHAAHATSACTDCHKARNSKTSGDVLMPAIASCRDCHQGEHANRALPSTCIMCHVYHRDDQAPMFPRAHAVQAGHTQ